MYDSDYVDWGTNILKASFSAPLLSCSPCSLASVLGHFPHLIALLVSPITPLQEARGVSSTMPLPLALLLLVSSPLQSVISTCGFSAVVPKLGVRTSKWSAKVLQGKRKGLDAERKALETLNIYSHIIWPFYNLVSNSIPIDVRLIHVYIHILFLWISHQNVAILMDNRNRFCT